MVNKNKIILALVPLMLVVLISYVMASAVSVPYWSGLNTSDLNVKSLALNPGQSADFQATLQSDGVRDEVVRVRIVEGSDVVSITDAQNTYPVAVGVIDVPVHFKATVPANAPAGKVYNVRLEFSSSPASQSGQFQFGSSIVKKFDVVVVEKPAPQPSPVVISAPASPPETNYMPLMIVLVLIIVVLTVIVIKVGKNKSKRR